MTINHLNTALHSLENYFFEDETVAVETLLKAAPLSPAMVLNIQKNAEKLVSRVRETRLSQWGLDAFLSQYRLSSEEGTALMCMAEALLRIPDKSTMDKLIRDKICRADWEDYIGKSPSLFVNATSLGLMLTGKIIAPAHSKGLAQSLKRFMAKTSEPVIRKIILKGMKILGKQFVMGKNIDDALKNAAPLVLQGYVFSYDMLGEAARTQEDADRYFLAYQNAIRALKDNPAAGISIKLSALHPRYEFFQKKRVIPVLTEKLLQLAQEAQAANIGLTMDAEEAERLALSLEIFSNVLHHPGLKDTVGAGFGLAVQSYQKRGFHLIDWLAALARSAQKKITVRLIKGAYWDSEIKNAQIKGLAGYPVFTRKLATDVSFLACAKKIIDYGPLFYPAFATHNAYSLAAVLEMMGERRDFEFQCLHGMGYTLYNQIVGSSNLNIPCRVYAPVGGHEDLLAYLVRRLLENGTNTSFVNQIINKDIPIQTLIENPIETLAALGKKPHPAIVLPAHLYGPSRKNAMTINLANQNEREALLKAIQEAKPSVSLHTIDQNDPEIALDTVTRAFESFEKTPVADRATMLEKTADLLEKHLPDGLALLIREGKKTIPDALADIREAIDFCRYYAEQAKMHLSEPLTLKGPTGEHNQLFLRGRGPMVCISPWNFPLAIFIGQITAALACGNTVIAKPASQTLDIARWAISLLYQAGIPKEALQLMPVSGKIIGEKIIPDPRIKGVIFTGSTETAQHINRILANRSDQIVPFIAETGGQNAMIVDSSALPEQVVQDVIQSAFTSAGQRCSALRVLFLQEDIADKIIQMLMGAIKELTVGDPALLETDIGPVIDQNAYDGLNVHLERLSKLTDVTLHGRAEIARESASIPCLFAPTVFEIKHISQLTHEVFGPVLHIVRFSSKNLAQVMKDIHSTGYGLTLGIHSRIDETIHFIQQQAKVGNVYVNRNMIGAVVGVQPFGGEGASGTGPKAGGPHYLLRLCTERTVTTNATASGGNTALMALVD